MSKVAEEYTHRAFIIYPKYWCNIKTPTPKNEKRAVLNICHRRRLAKKDMCPNSVWCFRCAERRIIDAASSWPWRTFQEAFLPGFRKTGALVAHGTLLIKRNWLSANWDCKLDSDPSGGRVQIPVFFKLKNGVFENYIHLRNWVKTHIRSRCRLTQDYWTLKAPRNIWHYFSIKNRTTRFEVVPSIPIRKCLR